MRDGQLAWFSSLIYERRSGLIPICYAWVRSYGRGATVLIIHHSGLVTDRERGSTALRGAADTLMMTEKNRGKVILNCKKQRKDMEEFDALEFSSRVGELPDGRSSLVVQPLGEVSGPVATLRASSQRALEALQRSGPEGLRYSEWLHESGMRSKATFDRARKDLVRKARAIQQGAKYFFGDPTNASQS